MAGINDVLRKMREAGKFQDMKQKGNLGEDAVVALCADRRDRTGHGLLYQGFMYPYQKDSTGKVVTGNIQYNAETGKFVEYTSEKIKDEIDVLYITPFRIFPIEVKSYHATIDIDANCWLYKNGEPVEKSPLAQAEKHARHLYHAIYDVIPDGDPDYIVPICCFVDRCKIRDVRSQAIVDYIPVCTLNTFLKCIAKYNTPMSFNIDLEKVEERLEQVKTSTKKY